MEVWLRPGLCPLQSVTWGSILACLCLHILVYDTETALTCVCNLPDVGQALKKWWSFHQGQYIY